MIVRTAIDSDALLDHRDETRQSLNAHKTLTNRLREYGVVKYMGEYDRVTLHDSIRKLPQTSRDLWVATLQALDNGRLIFGNGDDTTRDICKRRQLPKSLHKSLDLVVISEQVGDQRNLPTEGFAQQTREPELSLADSVDNCATIDRVRSLRGRSYFPMGTQRDEIWSQVLAPPAELSREVTLLDKYFLKHALTKPDDRSRDHAEWLIRKLDATLKPRGSVRLLCELPPEWTPAQFQGARKHLQKVIDFTRFRHLASVQVVLAPWPWRRETKPHNRHLRFSCGLAVTCHEGFDSLDADAVRGMDGFTWGAVTSADVIDDLGKRENVILTRRGRMEIQIPAARPSRVPDSVRS